MTRAEPASVNDLVLQGGPLLLPLVLSTSAALYRGWTKRSRREAGEGVGTPTSGLLDALRGLPPGMWVGIGLVWAYWTSTQIGIF